MTLLVFGSTGQVARELSRSRPDAVFLGREQADLSQPETCAAAIANYRPSAIINAAAYTAVDNAESEEDLATVINAEAPGAMARAAASLAVPFVHISTDYVFDGGGDQPWQPCAPTNPVSAYGRSKLAGEIAIRAAGGCHAILRTSWVVSAHGSNFVKTMLRLGAERKILAVVADQIGAPTAASDIATACLRIADTLSKSPEKRGTYHFSGAPATSWADFAREIFSMAGLACEVIDIPSSDYPTPASRPLNSLMDTSATTATFGLPSPDWRDSLNSILQELQS